MYRSSRVFTAALALVAVAACSEGPTSAPAPDDSRLPAYGTVVGPYFDLGFSSGTPATQDGPLLVPAVGAVLNGSFESNGGPNSTLLTNWTTFNQGNGAVFAQTGTVAPISGHTVPAPPHLSFAAMSAQSGAGLHIWYQDINVPAGPSDLHFDLFIGNRAGVFIAPPTLSTGVPNQQFRADIMNPAAPITDVGAGVLANIYHTLPGHPLVVGYTHVVFNLSAFAGQTVRLRFAEVDNQFFFQAGTDNVWIDLLNLPPEADAGADQTVECAGDGTSVTLDGSGSSDPDGDALTYSWSWAGGSASGVSPTVNLPKGTHTITLTVDDGKGGTDTDEVVVDVVDSTAPTLTLSMLTTELWPPNHTMHTVATVSASDVCCGDATIAITVTSNEPDNGLGDGDTPNDTAVIDNGDGTYSVQVRAERAGNGSGRVYTITATATDCSGNSATASGEVKVPHSKGKK